MNFLNLLWVYFKMVSWKRQINLISSYPQFSDENSGFTTLPSKALSGQVWFRYQCFCFLKLFIFNGETYRNKHFSSQKNDGIFHIFKVSRVPSGIAIFAFRVNWNYAYSPFKNPTFYFTTWAENISWIKNLNLHFPTWLFLDSSQPENILLEERP